MMDESSLNALRAALDAYVDPYLGESLGAAQAVQSVTASSTGAFVRLRLGFPVGGYRDELTASLKQHLAARSLPTSIEVELEADIRAHAVQRNLKPLERIKNV